MTKISERRASDENYGKIESSFEQVPYNTILDRLESGTQCMHEFSRIIAANLENMQRNISFSSSISRTHIYEHEILHSGTEKSLGFFKNYHLFVAKQEVQYYKDLADIVFKHTEEVKTNRLATSLKHKNAVQSATKEVHHASDALEKAKKQYMKAITEVNVAKEKLQQLDSDLEKLQEEKKSNFMGRMLSAFESTPMQDREKQHRRVMKRINNVIISRKDIIYKRKLLKEKIGLRDIAIAQATEAAQALEYDRLQCIKDGLKKFTTLEEDMIKVRQSLLSNLSDVIEHLNVEEDLQIFVQNEKKSEFTHKYRKALDLLEWDHAKRCAAVNAQEMEKIVTINGKPIISLYPTSSSSSSSQLQVALDMIPEDDIRLISTPSSSVSDNHHNDISKLKAGHHSNSISSSSPPMMSTLSKVTPRLFSRSMRFDSSSTSSSTELTSSSSSSSSTANDDIQHHHHQPVNIHDQVGHVDDNDDMNGITMHHSVDDASNIIHVPDILDHHHNRIEEVLNDESGLIDDDIISYEASIRQALDDIFSSSSSLSSSSMISSTHHDDDHYSRLCHLQHEDRWKEMLLLRRCRDIFLQELDDKRGTHAELSSLAFQAMQIAMKVILDHCLNLLDRKSALRVVNMANTFHHLEMKPSSSDIEPSSSSAAVDDTHDHDNRNYLLKQAMIRSHAIWHGKGFWEYCLMERISAQLQFATPVLWDEISSEALREAVVDIHNIVFGQLGTIAFTMHEIGLTYEEVQGTILELSRGAQLVEDQEHDLLKSIRKTFNISHKSSDHVIYDADDVVEKKMSIHTLSLAAAEGVSIHMSDDFDPLLSPHLKPMKMRTSITALDDSLTIDDSINMDNSINMDDTINMGDNINMDDSINIKIHVPTSIFIEEDMDTQDISVSLDVDIPIVDGMDEMILSAQIQNINNSIMNVDEEDLEDIDEVQL